MPKQNKETTSLPTNYPVCEHSSCPMAATCLHHIAYTMMMEQNEEYLQLINPARCSKDESCDIRQRIHQLPKAYVPTAV